MAGDPSTALELVDQAIAIWEQGGAVPPDLLIQRGDIVQSLRGPGDPEVERGYERAVEVARGLGMSRSEHQAQTRLTGLRSATKGGENDN